MSYECNSNQDEVQRNESAIFTLKLQLSDSPGSQFAKFVLNYDNQYSFGGDILVYYKIKSPEPPTSAAEAELKELMTDYNPAVEIQKAIDMSKPKIDDENETDAKVKECKSALQRYDELMNEFDGYKAKQVQQLLQQEATAAEASDFQPFVEDQESDDDEDPVVMQDWTKKIAMHMEGQLNEIKQLGGQMCKIDAGIALNAAQNSEARAQNLEDQNQEESDEEEFEERKCGQKVGSIEALLMK